MSKTSIMQNFRRHDSLGNRHFSANRKREQRFTPLDVHGKVQSDGRGWHSTAAQFWLE
jgi:hypothetical protein